MKPALLLLLAVVVTGTAAAQIDPDPDSIGVYFDQNAEVIHFDGFGNAVAYIIVTHCSYDAIYALEGALHIEDQGSIGFIGAETVPFGVDGFNIGTPPNFLVAYGAPIPVAGPATVVAEMSFGYFGAGGACFTLGPHIYDPSIPGHIVAQVGPMYGEFAALYDSANGGVCATMGFTDCEVVATDAVRFSELKALFR